LWIGKLTLGKLRIGKLRRRVKEENGGNEKRNHATHSWQLRERTVGGTYALDVTNGGPG
jgi:hypothetical protein